MKAPNEKLTLEERVDDLEADIGGLMIQVDSILDVLSNFQNAHEQSVDEKYNKLEEEEVI